MGFATACDLWDEDDADLMGFGLSFGSGGIEEALRLLRRRREERERERDEEADVADEYRAEQRRLMARDVPGERRERAQTRSLRTSL